MVPAPPSRRHSLSSALPCVLALAIPWGIADAQSVAILPIPAARTPGPHVLPRRGPPGHNIAIASVPSGAHLTYYGGRVVTNIKVIEVLWGSGSFLPELTSASLPNMGSFYAQILASPYLDWLAEYDTNLPSQATRTNQVVGRGTFAGKVSISPAIANNGASITDNQIAAEISAQILAGNLPRPATDAAGNGNTLYAVYFPHGKSISLGTQASCVSGGFCAYHNTTTLQGNSEIYYAVHPDMQPGSGCDTGCGGAATAFANATAVASHELVEVITDPEVGIAPGYAPPLAWYDSVNGEIGDLCNAQQGAVTGTDGITYTVQQEFSNAKSACIATYPLDFSLSLGASSLGVSAGSSASLGISTLASVGASEPVLLSVTGLPTGVSAAFAPNPVASGAGSTLTLAAAATTSSASLAITVTGTGATSAHSAVANLVISGPSSDFAVSLAPASLTVAPGGSVQCTVASAVVLGSPQALTFSLSALPAGVSGAFGATSVAAGQSTTLTLTAAASAAPTSQAWGFTVTASSDSIAHVAGATLSVATPAAGNDAAEVPLPGWALALLGMALAGRASRRKPA
jgi:hypothetical protein